MSRSQFGPLTRALLLALAFALRPAQVADQPCEPLEAGVDREEHFALVLDAPVTPDGRPATPITVGAARWRARGGARSQVELHAHFFEDDLRVQHVETVDATGAELVWREWRPGQGRTLRARHERGRLELVEWGRSEVLRLTSASDPALWLPLHWIEAARSGHAPQSVQRLDPLGRRVESLRLELSVAADARRRARWTDVEGGCAGEFDFAGDSLAEFRWQAGALRGRAIDADEYARLEREHGQALSSR